MHGTGWRATVAALLAIVALAIGAMPWIAAFLPVLDSIGAAVPLAPVLSVAALLIGGWRARLAAIAALVAIALSLVTLLPEWRARQAFHPGSGSVRLVIVTHNVATANIDPAGTITALLSSDADVLLLQEAGGTMASYLDRLRTRFPYGSVCARRCSLAIFSRYPVDPVRYRFRDVAGRRYGPALVQTRIHLPGGAVAEIVTLHLSRHVPARDRVAQRQELVDAIRRIDNRALLLGGDFNLTPWQHDLRAFDRALAPMQRATRALPSFPARLPDGWPAFPVLPIDHLYAGPDWGVKSVRRLQRTGSDHIPIRIELVLIEQPAMVSVKY